MDGPLRIHTNDPGRWTVLVRAGGGPAQHWRCWAPQERGLDEWTHRQLQQPGLSRNTGGTPRLRRMHPSQRRPARGQPGPRGRCRGAASTSRHPASLPQTAIRTSRGRGASPSVGNHLGEEQASSGWSCLSGHLPRSADLDWSQPRGCWVCTRPTSVAPPRDVEAGEKITRENQRYRFIRSYEPSVLTLRTVNLEARGREKSSFRRKPNGGLRLGQSLTVIRAQDCRAWLGKGGGEETVEGPDHSTSLLTQGGKRTDLEEGCPCFQSTVN